MGLRVVRRTKRLWTDEEKRSICVQTTAPDVSVAQVARRYPPMSGKLSAALLFLYFIGGRDRMMIWDIHRNEKRLC